MKADEQDFKYHKNLCHELKIKPSDSCFCHDKRYYQKQNVGNVFLYWSMLALALQSVICVRDLYRTIYLGFCLNIFIREYMLKR